MLFQNEKGLQMNKSIITLLCAASMIISTPSVAENLRIKRDAPARYTVKQGDTLWDISSQYLYRPWKWPKLWRINRDKIANPHLIYPGQVLVLHYVNGQPVLDTEGGIPTVKLSPRVRDAGSGYAINTINVDFYGLFMKHPQFLSSEELLNAARLVAGSENRSLYTVGDRIYADGISAHGEYLIFRLKHALKDPKNYQDLGQLVEFVGEAMTLATPNSALSHRSLATKKALRDDEYYAKVDLKPWEEQAPVVRTAQPLLVTQSVSEISQNDYLIPKPEGLNRFNFVPHEPKQPVEINIVEIMDGVSESGAMQTLILNKGLRDGVDRGTVLGVYKRSRVVPSSWKVGEGSLSAENKLPRLVIEDESESALHADSNHAHSLQMTHLVNTPVEEVALAMVYRAGEHVSSAIILESVKSVSKDDLLANPGRDLDTFGVSERVGKLKY